MDFSISERNEMLPVLMPSDRASVPVGFKSVLLSNVLSKIFFFYRQLFLKSSAKSDPVIAMLTFLLIFAMIFNS
jgi:hypothetical protein